MPMPIAPSVGGVALPILPSKAYQGSLVAPTVPNQYSGIVINQNALATGSVVASNQVFQTFYLPSNYRYGSNANEYRYPDLSGLQVLVNVASGAATTASLSYRLDYYIFGTGWVTLTSGTVVGAQADNIVWFDVILPQSIPISQALSQSLFRLGVQGLSGVTGFSYVQPNPLTMGAQAYQANGTTPLLATASSLNFRILALTADSGTDFLGNEYRSIVTQASASNTSTTGGINTGYWLSDPAPSRFAVKNLYTDVRPFPSSPTYGITNLMLNPSFEYDGLNAVPAVWAPNNNLVTQTIFQVRNAWASTGSQSLRSTTSFTTQAGAYGGVTTPTGTSGMPVLPGVAYSVSAVINTLALPTSPSIQMNIAWYTSTGTLIAGGTTVIAGGLGVQTLAGINMISPPNSAFVSVSVTINSPGAGTGDFYLDAVLFVKGAILPAYFDGDMYGYQWAAQPGQSPSVQVTPASLIDQAVVVDSVYLDPLTPGVAFNVYYSTDGGTVTTESAWEQKLWTRVPKSFIASQRDTYVLPAPIKAKFIKIEFSYLQAQAYNVGNFQKPITYKKFPKWVTDFFIAQMQTPQFIADRVNVVYDALNFAYNYYLDDLGQEPDQPAVAPINAASTLTTFLTDTTGEQVDATTLAKINLTFQQFQQPPGTLADPATLLGQVVLSAAQGQTNYSVEATPNLPPINYSDVSSLNREAIIFEQSMPVMFFYLTCRHSYREVAAQFSHNRAYFAGVKEIAFLRNAYTAAADDALYIESAGDTVNIDRSDFVSATDGNLYTY